jgi:hypothetical protein
MGGFLQFLWRAIQSQPVTTIFGAFMVMAGISYQDWLTALAKEPPWFLTNHVVQLAIILLGILMVAFVFYRQSEADRTSKPRPDMDLSQAIDYLRVRSRWAVGRVYYNSSDDRILEEDIDQIIRDVAAQGRITIWGRPGVRSVVFGEPTEIEIPRTEWPNMSLDLTTMEGNAPNGVCARGHGQDQYCRLRVDRREIYREWPRAFYGRFFFDKTWKGRKERSV